MVYVFVRKMTTKNSLACSACERLVSTNRQAGRLHIPIRILLLAFRLALDINTRDYEYVYVFLFLIRHKMQGKLVPMSRSLATPMPHQDHLRNGYGQFNKS